MSNHQLRLNFFSIISFQCQYKLFKRWTQSLSSILVDLMEVCCDEKGKNEKGDIIYLILCSSGSLECEKGLNFILSVNLK